MTDESEALERALTDLLKAGHRLVRQRRAVSNTLGQTWSQTTVMARLDLYGPATTADLAREEAVRPQSMGATLAALEGDGLVERRPHPTDGRQMLFALSAKGEAVRRDSSALKQGLMRELVTKLTPQDQAVMEAATALLRRIDPS